MPQINQPYYALHQISKGLYTEGNEYVFEDGSEYVGLYHITPNGQRFSGPRPERTTKQLFIKRLTQTGDNLVYNKLSESQFPKYVSPVLITPLPTNEDYNRNYIQRCFVQKRNNPLNTIIEVDSQQYNSVNTTNKPGINGVIWNRCLVKWIISKIPQADAKYINESTLIRTSVKFPHLGQYVKNSLEYYR